MLTNCVCMNRIPLWIFYPFVLCKNPAGRRPDVHISFPPPHFSIRLLSFCLWRVSLSTSYNSAVFAFLIKRVGCLPRCKKNFLFFEAIYFVSQTMLADSLLSPTHSLDFFISFVLIYFSFPLLYLFNLHCYFLHSSLPYSLNFYFLTYIKGTILFCIAHYMHY